MSVIDTDYLVKALLDAAEQGVKLGLKQVQNQAQKHAPVRDIFQHGRGTQKKQSRAEQFAGARWANDFSRVWTAMATGGPIASLATMSPHDAQKAGFFTTGQLATRTGRIVQKGAPDPERQQIRGRANSYMPVINSPIGRIGGELRNWAGPNVLEIGLIKNPGGKDFELASLLSSRGRYEAFGKANAKGERKGKGRALHTIGGQTMVGGTLHDGITVDGPYRDGAEVYGYVQAIAHDPKRTHNYAKDQEFGSRHNKAQPFLRPGLRESHGRIVKMVDPTTGAQRGLLQRAIQSPSRARPSADNSGSMGIPVVVRVTVAGIGDFNRNLEELLGLDA